MLGFPVSSKDVAVLEAVDEAQTQPAIGMLVEAQKKALERELWF